MQQQGQAPLQIEHYIIGKTLGVGAFGKVKLAKHNITNTQVAIKIINKRKMKNSRMGAKIRREIRLLRYFNHPNVIKLYEVLDTPGDIFVVMEYAERGELFDLIAQRGKLPESEARNFFLQILSGVEYCHNNLVAHRDLKPENILITHNYVVKIADFGLSNLMKDGKYLKTSCGSPNYAAPEVISGKTYCGSDADVWSCGVILYALLAGFLPFDEETTQALFKKIKSADYTIPSSFSPQVRDLINRMLTPDPLKRIKFHEIHLHPYMRSTQVPFYLQIPFKLDEGRRQINEDVFEKLMQLQTVNFRGMTQTQIQKSIRKREDKSFVVIYDLLLGQLGVESSTPMTLHNLTMHDLIFNPQIPQIEGQSFNNCLLNEIQKPQPYDYGKELPKDIMAIVYPYQARQIVNAIYTCLEKFNTVIKIKSPDYKLKCYHKNLIKMTKYNSSMELFNEFQKEVEETGSKNDLASLTFKDDGKKPKVKENKYSAKEIIFNIQIYKMPTNNNDHMIDFQLCRGHPVVFMDFCNKVIALLNQHFNQI
ncbi:unnamed protein product [Paramecium octaurelia]|uniref:Non-specific serine/threonine protein kinase n=1 Tax=Paramecium octaurelia TaxID=43137 RepID=A0A8S1UTU5_PAROT|nr:unnamed protein product [Paramecium octaurelia]